MAPHVKQSNLVKFGDEVVNLPSARVKKYRRQVKALRDRLAAKIQEDDEFALVKMLHSGSVAKGTALKTINDMDVAVYVRKAEAPTDESEMLEWLADRLREANPNLCADQFTAETHCVTVNFKGSGLNVDVVPVLYEEDPDDRGYLLNRNNGTWLETSVRLHLDFIRKRKQREQKHFAQVIRFLKWWVRLRKTQDAQFRFKSFMVELLCSHMLDNGHDFTNYVQVFQEFFAMIVQSELRTRIAFDDYYPLSCLPKDSLGAIQIYDPVNPDNNVTENYSEWDRSTIVEASVNALNALTEAQFSNTKGREIDLWKEVLGPSFKVQ